MRGVCDASCRLRVANERTKARFSAPVSVGKFWYLVFSETLLSRLDDQPKNHLLDQLLSDEFFVLVVGILNVIPLPILNACS